MTAQYIPIDTANPNPPPGPGAAFTITGIGTGCSFPSPIGSWQLESYDEVTLLCPGAVSNCWDINSTTAGVVGTTYYRDYYFCPSNCMEYEIRWDDCCRNNVITSGSASDGMHLGGIIIRPNDPGCNESPTFTEEPAVQICQNSLTAVSQGAVDPEGDSLVYSLVQCMDNSSLPVGYLQGYSPQAPLGPHWSVNLDSQTGWLSFVPDSAAGLEIGVLCVQVEEYRNGQFVGSVTRDIQVSVVACDTGQAPVASPVQVINGGQAIAADTIEACPLTPVTFQLAALDPDISDVLTISSSVAAVLPGAQLTISGTNPAVMEVSWTPAISDFNQVFEFILSAYDETCPYPLQTYRSYFIKVAGPCIGGLVTDTQCNDSTGAVDLTVFGGTPPYSFLWNTGAITEDLSNLSDGTYWVDVTDSAGSWSFTDTFYVDAQELVVFPVFTPPDCDGNGGGIDLQIFGGTVPYSYGWNTGSQFNSLSGISSGGYSVSITDGNGCQVHEVFFLESPDSCFVSVSGTAYYDLNGNCVQDSNELGIPYLFLELTPGSATFTDANGDYSVFLDTGAYVLEAQAAPGTYLTPNCPATAQHALSLASYASDTSGLDFAMGVIPVQDLRVAGGFTGSTVPGFPYVYALSVYNEGSLPTNATLEWQLDPFLSYTSASLTPASYDSVAHILSWQINPILPGQVINLQVMGSIDSTAMIGDSVQMTASIQPIPGDTTPANNVFTDLSPVVGSFDPNDKQVSPRGFGEAGFIQVEENEMRYTIRFQNTGNFPAQYVEIRDTIHHNLDLSSYRPLTQIHPYSLDVKEDSILIFTFANIQLPDSATDPLGSQGQLSFSLLHNGTLALGDQIPNSAGIYFDFNEPIQTNEVLNTIYSPMELNFLMDETLCSGDTVFGMLTEVGLAPFSYVWNTGEEHPNSTQLTSPTAVTTPGFYTLTVTDALGISETDSVYLDITQFPIAQASTDIQGLQVQFLDASLHTDSWLWDFGDGQTSTEPSPTHLYASIGGYLVRLTVQNECGADTLEMAVPILTAIEDEFARTVEVIPNPFSLWTRIRFANPTHEAFELILLDMKGKAVRTYEGVRNGEILINRKELSSGIYLFQLRSEEHRYIGKLMIR